MGTVENKSFWEKYKWWLAAVGLVAVALLV